MTVKEAAQQVVSALPADATFSDLGDFLFERATVEQAREEFAIGSVLSTGDVLRDEVGEPATFLWAESAAGGFEELRAAAKQHYPDELPALIDGLRSALARIGTPEGGGITLPEMGDPTIREIRFRAGRLACRLLFESQDGACRILWFTNNTSCYRGVRGVECLQE